MAPVRITPTEPSPDPPPAPDRGELVRLPVAHADAQLVAAIRAGDASAVQSLFERHAPHVRRIVARVLGFDPDLNDVVQDVFVAALEGLNRLDDPLRLRGFLTGICARTAAKSETPEDEL